MSDAAASRRPHGQLESDVLAVLWATDAPLSPGEVNDALGGALARTTVTTILTRLYEKDLVRRERAGRGYVYAAAQDASGIVATRMHTELSKGADRDSVLRHFVSTLSPGDEALLRSLLADAGGAPERT
ncbi:BlaI/MecI/CopY family transcriptional regulator [Kitasatospora sp. NPDC085879]|uniref:BlaI/MecI/CopY family transcriptional regulator n=1 Tax=Kitasatospora sp. NPDC085879 TaxID=3154769 RepID=UPI000BB12E81|nr:BlaI/MecI/CopY family transcriptional regulator [Streptomyces sp. TLI_235]PBC67369.1 putative transcriptional regulator [Streptomyces sp. TLI_235]